MNIGRGGLDELFPNWYSKVDLETLNLIDPDLCVLGQVCGGFISARGKLDSPIGSTDVFALSDFKPYWIDQITQRMEESHGQRTAKTTTAQS